MPTDRPYDGVNLIPYLSGENSGAPHEQLFWRLNERRQAATTDGRKKLVKDGPTPDQLFDLATDIGESKNMAESDPAATARLNQALDAWFHRMATKLAFPGNEGPEREWPEFNGAKPSGRPASQP
jgi:hypothetical protein